jgi:hypothetical protein
LNQQVNSLDPSLLIFSANQNDATVGASTVPTIGKL